MGTHRVEVFQVEANDDQMNLNLDLVDERRDHAPLRNASYQQRVARYYNSRVKHLAFQVSDLVLCKVMLVTRKPSNGSLGPTWEGPYCVFEVVHSGTYRLKDLKGANLPHPWDAEHLKKYYH